MLVKIERQTPTSKEEVRDYIHTAESLLMKFEEKVELEINHYFSKDVYAREMIVPSGTVVVGKIHKHQNLNILSKGEVSIISIDGVVRVKAPYTLVASPGAKRLFYAHEDSVWTVIHGTNLTDLSEIEKAFIVEDYSELEENI